jgi:hypothetical protein
MNGGAGVRQTAYMHCCWAAVTPVWQRSKHLGTSSQVCSAHVCARVSETLGFFCCPINMDKTCQAGRLVMQLGSYLDNRGRHGAEQRPGDP